MPPIQYYPFFRLSRGPLHFYALCSLRLPATLDHHRVKPRAPLLFFLSSLPSSSSFSLLILLLFLLLLFLFLVLLLLLLLLPTELQGALEEDDEDVLRRTFRDTIICPFA